MWVTQMRRKKMSVHRRWFSDRQTAAGGLWLSAASIAVAIETQTSDSIAENNEGINAHAIDTDDKKPHRVLSVGLILANHSMLPTEMTQ
jgi:hypothetical protein